MAYDRLEIEKAALRNFLVGASDMGDPWLACKQCGDHWDNLGGLTYDPTPLVNFIQKAWDHFLGGC